MEKLFFPTTSPSLPAAYLLLSKCRSLLKRMMRDTLKLPSNVWQGIKVDRKANGSMQLLPEHLLTEDEMSAMVAATSSTMYKVMLSVLFECDLRL